MIHGDGLLIPIDVAEEIDEKRWQVVLALGECEILGLVGSKCGWGVVWVLMVARGDCAFGTVRDSELMFPHPRPLPRGGVLGVWRGWFRVRGGRFVWIVDPG